VSGFAAAMSTRVPVSVIVPIKNEAANLPRCLASVKWADEILVVDSASTDGSIAIAQQHGAKVVQFEFNGTWPKKKNWALENLQFRNEWVFVLDADEALPPEAETEFAQAIADGGILPGTGSIVVLCSWDAGCGMPTIPIGTCAFFGTPSAVMKN